MESGRATERSAEAKLDEADQYQDKTEEAYKVRHKSGRYCHEVGGDKRLCCIESVYELPCSLSVVQTRGCVSW